MRAFLSRLESKSRIVVQKKFLMAKIALKMA
nr:MAG TPA: hypothetical protein [Caudoviricetes sp.]